jgi:Methyltransferase domain
VPASIASWISTLNSLSDASPGLLEEGIKPDFAFVDGMHTFDYAFTDFFFLDKMLKPGGVIIFDDLGYPSIRKLCRSSSETSIIQSAPRPCRKLALRAR